MGLIFISTFSLKLNLYMYDKYVDIYTGVMDSEAQSKQNPEDNSFFQVKGDKFSVLQYPDDSSGPDLSAFWKRPPFYSDGNGVKLKYIPTVVANIEAAPDTFIEMMHRLLYLHVDDKSVMRRNILEFNGLKDESGTVNYVYRMRILSVLSVQQLTLISNVLCLPVCQYSRQFLADNIMSFLLIPQVINMDIKVLPVSKEKFAISFDCSKVDEIILKEPKSGVTEEGDILPDIHGSEETPHTSKETLLTLENPNPTELKIQETRLSGIEKYEMISDAQLPQQTPVVSHLGPSLHNESAPHPFSKTVDVPNVLQACQNYDYRYQRELLKSGVTLTLHSDEYLDQAIRDEDAAFRLACAKYMRNYHADRRQQSPRMTSGQRFQESEEQASARRAQNALRMRNYRQGLRALETEEQAAERRAQNALRMRNYRRFKRELEPELAAERRAQNAQRMRHYRKIKRELEPEISALRRAQNALRMRNYRKNKRQQEPE